MQLVIGRVVGAHGIRGEVSVDVRTDDPEVRFASGARIYTEPGAAGPLTVRVTRWHARSGGRLLIRFAEVTDRTAAERLRDTLLVLESAELEPSGGTDEWNDHELIGLAVARSIGEGGDDGGALGTVEDVLHLPSQDLLVVRLLSGGEVLIPFVVDIVPEVDVAMGRLLIDPPPGLIDEQSQLRGEDF